jgi:serine/threonine-protein phosphatase 2A regulatory subunit B'
MDPRLFDECSTAYQEKQEKEVERLASREAHWQAIEQSAESNPLFPRVKHALKAKASLAFAMRAQQAKTGMTMFDDWHLEDATAFSQMHGPPQPEQLRRKSTLPATAVAS